MKRFCVVMLLCFCVVVLGWGRILPSRASRDIIFSVYANNDFIKKTSAMPVVYVSQSPPSTIPVDALVTDTGHSLHESLVRALRPCASYVGANGKSIFVFQDETSYDVMGTTVPAQPPIVHHKLLPALDACFAAVNAN